MKIKSIDIIPHQLTFKKPARTSRGVYLQRQVYYVVVEDQEGRIGVGEAAPLPDLSPEAPNYEDTLRGAIESLQDGFEEGLSHIRHLSSIRFAVECAVTSLGKSGVLYDSPFTQGDQAMEINGLIWMGDHETMLRQIRTKLDQGFKCLKLKVGAIDLSDELDLLQRIRTVYSPHDLEIRLDANGAFDPQEVRSVLDWMATFHIHSIEQPIAAGQYTEMASLIRETPIPIALDEELIGVYDSKKMTELLDTLHPHYIILKPTLHGGLSGCDDWISMATQRGIAWWATSALESNIGLSAIAQWVATHRPTLPQGLGTGQLFETNVETPIRLRGQCVHFDPDAIATIGEPLEAIRRALAV